MTQQQQNKTQLEHKIISYIDRILITPYNFSLVIMTALWWQVCHHSPYNSNSNFDMAVTMSNFFISLNLVAIAVGLISASERSNHLIRLGMLGLILQVFALGMMKSFATYALYILGGFVLTPLSQFCFLLLVKNIWLAASIKKETVSELKKDKVNKRTNDQ